MAFDKKEYAREYYKKNKKSLNTYSLEYQKNDKEGKSRRARTYYINNSEKIKQKSRAYSKSNKEAIQIANRKSILRNYGLSIEQYNQMFEEQDGRCAICYIHQTELNKALFVDHDHDTGKVRGLLCPKCNTALGLLGDSIVGVKSALAYLENENS